MAQRQPLLTASNEDWETRGEEIGREMWRIDLTHLKVTLMTREAWRYERGEGFFKIAATGNFRNRPGARKSAITAYMTGWMRGYAPAV